MAGARRWKLGSFTRNHLARREETFLWTPGRYRRWRKYSRSGGAIMRAFMVAAILALACWPVAIYAQTAPRSGTATTQAAAKSIVPRASNGKPDLTGVWQGGSTQRGSWEEANQGVGVGGSG